MKYYTATRIHNGVKFEPEGTVLAVADDGSIADLIPAKVAQELALDIQTFEGILCPGFINAHCHLELSHLKGAIEEDTGLVGFVSAIPKVRQADATAKRQAIENAVTEMLQNGIVALGDIANTTDTLFLQNNTSIYLHTFVEAMGVMAQSSETRFVASEHILHQFLATGTKAKASMVPHAPYSVCPALMQRIATHSKGKILSIHSQESKAEMSYFSNKTGSLTQLYERLGIPSELVDLPILHPLAYIFKYLDSHQSIILVHNTYTNTADLAFLQQQSQNITLCLCPNANWYIERRLPDIPAIIASGMQVCLGTDSLASNYQLSVLEEIKRILEHFPQTSLEVLLKWACYGGAKALQVEEKLGMFAKGYRPGINLINQNFKICKML